MKDENGSSVGADAPAPSTALARTQTQDRDLVRQRRALVARLRLAERLNESQIVERLAKAGFHVSRWTVARDLDAMRRMHREAFSAPRFDAISFVLEKVATY